MRLLRVLLLAALPAAAAAQPVAVDGGAAAAPAPVTHRTTGARLIIGQDGVVAADEQIADGVAVLGGSLRVEGRVLGDVLVVGGDLHLTSTADVRGDAVLVDGALIRDPGAALTGSVSETTIRRWAGAQPLLAWRPGPRWGEFARWLSLAGTMGRILLLACLMTLVLAVARAPVARVGRAAAAEPLRAAAVGLVAEVLFVPLLLVMSISLGITIVGLPFVALLVPLAIAAALVALLLGYTALACRLGEWLEDRLGWRPTSAWLATVLGLAVIVAPTVLARVAGVAPEPLRWTAVGLLVTGLLVEFTAWTIGLGATLLTGFGRWHTVPPPIDARPA